jgi:hypothetical protein
MSDLSLPLLRISIVIAMIFGASAGRTSQLQLSSSAVSITATPEPDWYLIADYSKILLFDKHDGSKRRYGGRQSASWYDADSLNRGDWARYRRVDKDASFLGRCVQPSYNGFFECGDDVFFKLPEQFRREMEQ